MAKQLSKKQFTLLGAIAAATVSAAGMAYHTEKEVKLLVDGGYVECNVAMQDPDNSERVATRITKKGNEYMTEYTPTPEAATENAPASQFAVETGVPMIATTRNRASTSIYPFGDLAAPQGEGDEITYSSFFVPATEARPHPAKSLASTVSSAAKRWATVDGTRPMKRRNDEGELVEVQVKNYVYSRKFVVRKVTDENGNETGARVYRTL